MSDVFHLAEKKSFLRWLGLCLFLLAACRSEPAGPAVPPEPVADDDDSGDDATGDDDATDDGRITYNDDIQPILDNYCGVCHGGNPADSCMGDTCFSNHYLATLYPAYSLNCVSLNKAECGLYRIEATIKNADNAGSCIPNQNANGPGGGDDDDSSGCVPAGLHEFDCSDGVDEDCDGDTDCDDVDDCGLDTSCPPGDDDDSAPCATPGHMYETNCSDGIDEDCDGDTDCYDGEDCGLDPACNDDDPGNTLSETDVLRYPDDTLIIVDDDQVEMIRQWIQEGMVED